MSFHNVMLLVALLFVALIDQSLLLFKSHMCQYAHGFLNLLLSAKSVCVLVCVCVGLPPGLLITSGMIWTHIIGYTSTTAFK